MGTSLRPRRALLAAAAGLTLALAGSPLSAAAVGGNTGQPTSYGWVGNTGVTVVSGASLSSVLSTLSVYESHVNGPQGPGYTATPPPPPPLGSACPPGPSPTTVGISITGGPGGYYYDAPDPFNSTLTYEGAWSGPPDPGAHGYYIADFAYVPDSGLIGVFPTSASKTQQKGYVYVSRTGMWYAPYTVDSTACIGYTTTGVKDCPSTTTPISLAWEGCGMWPVVNLRWNPTVDPPPPAGAQATYPGNIQVDTGLNKSLGTIRYIPDDQTVHHGYVHTPTCFWVEGDQLPAPNNELVAYQYKTVNMAGPYGPITMSLLYVIDVKPQAVHWDFGDGTTATGFQSTQPPTPAYHPDSDSWTDQCAVDHRYDQVREAPGYTVTAWQTFDVTTTLYWANGLPGGSGSTVIASASGPITRTWPTIQIPVDQIQSVPVVH